MGLALAKSAQFELQTCISCGCDWYMPEILLNTRRKDRQSFYCPNGHSQAFITSEADTLRQKLAIKEQELAKERAARWEEAAKAQKLERKLKRVKNGVCPCCKRTFENLGRHMKTEHKEFLVEKI